MFVAYDPVSTRLLPGERKEFVTRGAAVAAVTRARKKGAISPTAKYQVAEADHFHLKIEKTKSVRNLQSGKWIDIPVNTPPCLDPSTETYWSM